MAAKIWDTLKLVNRLHIPNESMPTPIQAQAFSLLLPTVFGATSKAQKPSDTINQNTIKFVALAPTGSGKTLAFGVPLAYRCLVQGHSGLVLCITRELCIQTGKNLKAVVKAIRRIPEFQSSPHVHVGTIYGGMPREEQEDQLRALRSSAILVATTGRLLDVLESSSNSSPHDANQGVEGHSHVTVFLRRLSHFVIDEADRMASHSDLTQQVDKVLHFVPHDTSRIFASATWPQDTDKWKEWIWGTELDLTKDDMATKACLVVRVNLNNIQSSHIRKAATTTESTVASPKEHPESNETSKVVWAQIPENITQTVHVCSEHKKPRKLMLTLQKIRDQSAKDRHKPLCIVFFGTIKSLQYCAKLVTKEGFSCLTLHSHIPQHVRETNVQMFSSGKASLLLATDVAARGIHINHVRAVIQYDFPCNLDQYIHRCGVSNES
jgi:ATP-dependent RNA helicase DDX5/DBP2